MCVCGTLCRLQSGVYLLGSVLVVSAVCSSSRDVLSSVLRRVSGTANRRYSVCWSLLFLLDRGLSESVPAGSCQWAVSGVRWQRIHRCSSQRRTGTELVPSPGSETTDYCLHCCPSSWSGAHRSESALRTSLPMCAWVSVCHGIQVSLSLAVIARDVPSNIHSTI